MAEKPKAPEQKKSVNPVVQSAHDVKADIKSMPVVGQIFLGMGIVLLLVPFLGPIGDVLAVFLGAMLIYCGASRNYFFLGWIRKKEGKK